MNNQSDFKVALTSLGKQASLAGQFPTLETSTSENTDRDLYPVKKEQLRGRIIRKIQVHEFCLALANGLNAQVEAAAPRSEELKQRCLKIQKELQDLQSPQGEGFRGPDADRLEELQITDPTPRSMTSLPASALLSPPFRAYHGSAAQALGRLEALSSRWGRPEWGSHFSVRTTSR